MRSPLRRRPSTGRRPIRRTLAAAALTVATTAGLLAATPEVAHAATTWFVAPAGSGGSAAANCGTAALPCTTVTIVIAKAAFASGDVINVAAGTYVDRPLFGAKGADVRGAGTAVTIFDGSAANYAIGAVTTAAQGSLAFSNLTVRNGKPTSGAGGGLALGGSAPVTLTNVNATGSTATTGGAGIYAAGPLTYNTGTVSGNTVTGTNSANLAGGAGIYLAGGTANLSNVTVSGNTISGQQSLGGGIYVGAAATLNASSSTVSSNTASGLIGTGAGIAVLGTATLTGGSITGNQGTGANTFGGGIAVVTGSATINNATLSGNVSPYGGAGIVFQGASATLHGATVANNTSNATAGVLSGAGGGFYVAGKTASVAAGTLTVDAASSFTGNKADGKAVAGAGNGGAIFNAGTTNVSGGTTFSGNQAVASTNASSGRRGQGGAIMNGGQDADDAPILTISSSTITGGLAAGAFNASSGGGIANAENLGGGAPQLTATGVTLQGNTALLGGGLYNGGSATYTGGAISSSFALTGGGVYQAPLAVGTASPSSTFDGTTFTGNVANGSTVANFGNGGAIASTTSLTVKNATFTGNSTVFSSGVSGYGGTIFSSGTASLTDTTINGGAVSGGNATFGGAIANANPGTLTGTRLTLSKNVAAVTGGLFSTGNATLTDSTLDQNQATNTGLGFGGGLYVAPADANSPNPTVTLDGTDLTGNTAAVAGGGALTLKGGTLNVLHGSTVTGNTAAIGAGIYNAGTTTATDATIGDNDASLYGGGIYDGSNTATDTPVVTLTSTSVDGNTAAGTGGGIQVADGATLTTTDGTISTNSALGGGGVTVGNTGKATITGTDLVGNTATASGGGAVLTSGTTSISKALISGNHAVHTTGIVGLGGGIYSGSNDDGVATKLTVDQTTISGNDGYAGAAIVTISTGTGASNVASVDRSTIDGNTNIAPVGAVEAAHGITITNSTITDNTADTGASGALYLGAPAQTGLAGNLFSGNSGGSCTGGTPVDGGYNLAPVGDTSCGFTAGKHDVSAAAQIGALADNGGGTPTRLPSATSPALDQIPTATATGLTNVATGTAVTLCPAGGADQRGEVRPSGAKCDIGSVERTQVAPTITPSTSSADYSVGSAGAPIGFTTTGSPQPTLSVSGGSLPTGVTFHDNGNGTGTISGTPAAGTGGDYTVTVKAHNEAGDATTDVTITVHQAPVLGGPAADTYTVGQAGGPDVFHMTSGHPAATLSTTSTLPAGVTFTAGPAGTATIAGTPAAGTGGVYTIVIKGSNGTPPDASLTFTLTVNEGPSVVGPTTGTFVVGTAGSTTPFTATGFPAPTLSASGLPAGLALNGAGRIAGTPANGTGGEYDVVVTATNSTGTATANIHLVVDEAPELTGPTAARFVTGTPNTIGYAADGYPQASLSATGTLPSGVTFHDNGNGSATISGTAPTGAEGDYPITVTASNGFAPDSVVHLTIQVVPPVFIETTTLPGGTVGTAYTAMIEASGGQVPYTFTVVGGSLPAGLTLHADGTITGTPTGPTGTSTFTVKVADSGDPVQSSTKSLSITIGKGATTLVVQPVLLNAVNLLGIKVNIGYVSATLTGGDPAHGIAGQTIVFKSGATTVCTGVTDANGKVVCAMSVANTLIAVLNLGVTGTYAGNDVWLGSSGSAGLLLL